MNEHDQLRRHALYPRDPHHLGYAAQAAHDFGQMLPVAHLQGEVQCGVIALVAEMHVFDVGFCFRNGRGHFGQDTALVGHDQFDTHFERSADIFVPGDIQPFIHAAAAFAQ